MRHQSNPEKIIYDLGGIGIGPSNLSLAALLHPISKVQSIFFDEKQEFQWHQGMLFPNAAIQVSFLKDLVTLVDPTSKFSFLAFLAAKKRLYRFITARFQTVKRKEFNQYFQWICENLPNLHFNTRIQELDFKADHFILKYEGGEMRARNVVIGSGLTPKVPAFVEPHLCGSVFHASQYMQMNLSPKGKNIAVIGGGQSGAEIVKHLLSHKEQLPRTLYWVSKRSNFLPLDDSPFTNELFFPAYSEHFFSLPNAEKSRLIREQTLASDGINLQLLEEIYQLLYELEFMEKKEKQVQLLPDHTSIDFRQNNGNWCLYCQKNGSDQVDCLNIDAAVFATGFEHKVPYFFHPLRARLKLNQHQFVFQKDFSILWDGPNTNRIFVQNAARHARGIADPNLSLMAWRSATIINSMLCENVYAIENESATLDWSKQEMNNGSFIYSSEI